MLSRNIRDESNNKQSDSLCGNCDFSARPTLRMSNVWVWTETWNQKEQARQPHRTCSPRHDESDRTRWRKWVVWRWTPFGLSLGIKTMAPAWRRRWSLNSAIDNEIETTQQEHQTPGCGWAFGMASCRLRFSGWRLLQAAWKTIWAAIAVALRFCLPFLEWPKCQGKFGFNMALDTNKKYYQSHILFIYPFFSYLKARNVKQPSC